MYIHVIVITIGIVTSKHLCDTIHTSNTNNLPFLAMKEMSVLLEKALVVWLKQKSLQNRVPVTSELSQ